MTTPYDPDTDPFATSEVMSNSPEYNRWLLDGPAWHEELLYAECGCIAPCPDHSPKSVGKVDRDYWTEKYASDNEGTDHDDD